VTTEDFDAFVARLDGALLVVTAATEEERAGCIVGFHTQCSIDPPRYAVWLSKANFTYRVALFTTHLALHMVDAGDRMLLQLFGGTSGDRTEKFALVDWAPGPGGVPLLTQCPSRVVLERTTVLDHGGDHVCFVGTPVDAGFSPDVEPMRLADAADVEAGHEADERAAPAELGADEPAAAEHGSPMDAEDRRRIESAAAGAGHAIDLSPEESGADAKE
jgi:flavin reductase (DIM6/NTAB) family NADH-FMN oxidoreductase RutF